METPPWWQRLLKDSQRVEALEQRLAQPDIIADRVAFQRYSKELASLAPLVQQFRDYQRLREQQTEAHALAASSADTELQQMARDEAQHLAQRLGQLTERIESTLLERAAGTHRRIILEIRAGTGGEEAALFAADLLRMYTRYAATIGVKIEIMSHSVTELGGYREVIAAVAGANAYRKFKYESGIHRVQRVPTTEASGRIHTSAVTVAILPEPEGVDFDVQPQDLKIDVFRSSGPGGQSVNTTDSAVRITHLPTGVVVQCQDERSQLRNKDKALRVLRARLLAHQEAQARQQHAQNRKTQVGSGDRSEKIRTYNFPDHRLTDHRINLTLHQLDDMMNGDLDPLIDALAVAERRQLLQ